MSQSTLPSESAMSSDVLETQFQPSQPQTQQFHYRPVPILAPVSLFLGLCSIVGLTAMTGLGIGLMGTVLGAVCLVKIRRARGEIGGKWLAAIGFGLSFLFLVSGSALHAVTIATEVPEGYRKVNFTHDISKKKLVVVNGKQDFHPDVKALDGQQVFIKGYMYPTGQQEGLPAFLLVKDNQQCCFGGQPDMTDMIMVKMQKGMTVSYHENRLVSVGGLFQTQPVQGPAGLTSIYVLEGTFFERSKTSF